MKTRFLTLVLLVAGLGACASAPPVSRHAHVIPAPYVAPARCNTCGTVERIETVFGARENTHTGAVLGGIVGGIAGNQVGKGDGKKAATVAGVVAGAAAGNAIDKRANAQTYDITIRMDDGRRVVFNRNSLGASLRVGAYVHVDGNRLEVLH